MSFQILLLSKQLSGFSVPLALVCITGILSLLHHVLWIGYGDTGKLLPDGIAHLRLSLLWLLAMLRWGTLLAPLLHHVCCLWPTRLALLACWSLHLLLRLLCLLLLDASSVRSITRANLLHQSDTSIPELGLRCLVLRTAL